MSEKIIKLHHPTGNPYWQADQYKVELANGEIMDLKKLMIYPQGSYRIYWDDKGIWMQQCVCGSGYGKADLTRAKPVLLVQKCDYDKIEFVGKELKMSESLKDDLLENGLL